jgi:diguanylate cyclase (GGDEF)-like protein/PAS domain S-box-containing protein
MLGYEEAALLATTFQDLTHHEDLDADLEQVAAMLAGAIDTYEMEKRYLRADGRVIWALLSVSLVRDGDGRPLYFVSQLQDIEERKRAHGELEHLARTDELTGTLNRRAWDAELARAIVEAGESRRPLAIALIDLNGFKEVNDRHGHDAGDRVLKEAAAAWQAQLRPSDALARLGGDEFAVLLPQCAEEHLGHIVRRLKDAVPHAAGCGVGVAVWVDGESGEALIRRADDALYMDKSIGARRVL